MESWLCGVVCVTQLMLDFARCRRTPPTLGGLHPPPLCPIPCPPPPPPSPPHLTSQVPPGHVWLQGDNLLHSLDSREYGAVPMGLLRGRVLWQVGAGLRGRRRMGGALGQVGPMRP